MPDAALPPQRSSAEPKPTSGSRRGIETLFRTNYRSQLELTQLADNKANIMVSINGIIISITFGFVATRIEESPWLIVPTVPLLIGSVASLTLSVLAARPTWSSEPPDLEEVKENRNPQSLLHFGAFARLAREDFEQGMRHLMADREALYGNLIRDLYGLGSVLLRKYVRLRWAYTIFLVTLLVSVALSLGVLVFVAASS